MEKREIIFVTTNKGKIASAQHYFEKNDVTLIAYNHELIEPRSEDIQEIAKSKVLQAYEIVQKPCIALDSGFFIKSLNGFPKAYVNFALESIGVKGILKLMQEIEDRECFFEECLAYYDGVEIKYFFSRHEGTLSEQIKEIENKKMWSELWSIFIPEGFNKTMAEFEEAEHAHMREESVSSIKKFADWYETK